MIDRMKLAILSGLVLFASYSAGVCVVVGWFGYGVALAALAFAGQYLVLALAARARFDDLRAASRALDELVEEALANG
ncbi:hypothetical protein [Rhodoblastus sp.]|uniref:hypothetical protein n=1 Tax=Rhodoblastus sp. TaxID=1962975 RepID=UPI003F95D4D8